MNTEEGKKNRKFCSFLCCNNGWNHRTHTGISLYRKFKKEKCEKCGSIKFLFVHHKDRNRKNNHQGNLMTLCNSCHHKEHQFYKNFKEVYKWIPRNSKGRFGEEKIIGIILCKKCNEKIKKNNSRQEYCKKCRIKFDIGHRGKKRYG